jgi:lysophospholipase L1-like esterase
LKGSPRHLPLLGAILIGVVAAAGCGGPTGPSIVPPGLELSCPAPQTVPSISGGDAVVTFPLATVAGGTSPITVTCTPPSGSRFAVGTSIVTCVAVDAQQQSGRCSFNVTVLGPPKLAFTRFLAFGDSITEGKNGDDPAGGLLPNGGYPGFLTDSLTARYVTQRVTVANAGCGGEGVISPPPPPLPACSPQGTGVTRLPGTLDLAAPDVLLLLEGINDLFDGDPAKIPFVIDGLRSMVLQARNRNVRVALATLTPLGPSAHNHAAPILPTMNEQIRLLASQQGAVFVDLYTAFGGTSVPYIGVDGLHPNTAGYQKIADTFLAAIRANYEATSTSQNRLTLGPVSPFPDRR